jgi:hypothetical protein
MQDYQCHASASAVCLTPKTEPHKCMLAVALNFLVISENLPQLLEMERTEVMKSEGQ